MKSDNITEDTGPCDHGHYIVNCIFLGEDAFVMRTCPYCGQPMVEMKDKVIMSMEEYEKLKRRKK